MLQNISITLHTKLKAHLIILLTMKKKCLKILLMLTLGFLRKKTIYSNPELTENEVKSSQILFPSSKLKCFCWVDLNTYYIILVQYQKFFMKYQNHDLINMSLKINLTCCWRSPSTTLPPYFFASLYAERNSTPKCTSSSLASYQKCNICFLESQYNILE
jgi:hypothetical protein